MIFSTVHHIVVVVSPRREERESNKEDPIPYTKPAMGDDCSSG
jgi:hypothetical protein